MCRFSFGFAFHCKIQSNYTPLCYPHNFSRCNFLFQMISGLFQPNLRSILELSRLVNPPLMKKLRLANRRSTSVICCTFAHFKARRKLSLWKTFNRHCAVHDLHVMTTVVFFTTLLFTPEFFKRILICLKWCRTAAGRITLRTSEITWIGKRQCRKNAQEEVGLNLNSAG